MTAAARAPRARIGATALPNPGAAPALPRRPRLRIVPVPRRRAPRTPFVVLVIAMLAGGLLGVLVLNTQRAQDAFTLTSIQKHNAQLSDQVQSLRGEVQKDQTPEAIASRATALGMEPGGAPVFVDPSGKLLGVGAAGIVPLASGQRFGDVVVIGQAKKPTPTPSAAVTPTASASIAATTTASTPAPTAAPTPTPPVAPAAPAAGATKVAP